MIGEVVTTFVRVPPKYKDLHIAIIPMNGNSREFQKRMTSSRDIRLLHSHVLYMDVFENGLIKKTPSR